MQYPTTTTTLAGPAVRPPIEFRWFIFCCKIWPSSGRKFYCCGNCKFPKISLFSIGSALENNIICGDKNTIWHHDLYHKHTNTLTHSPAIRSPAVILCVSNSQNQTKTELINSAVVCVCCARLLFSWSVYNGRFGGGDGCISDFCTRDYTTSSL